MSEGTINQPATAGATMLRPFLKLILGGGRGRETPVTRKVARYAKTMPCSRRLAELLMDWVRASNEALAATEDADLAEIAKTRGRRTPHSLTRLRHRATEAAAQLDRAEAAIIYYRATTICDVLVKLRFLEAAGDLAAGAEAGHHDAVMLLEIVRDVERLAQRVGAPLV